jgi:hypothetical protein
MRERKFCDPELEQFYNGVLSFYNRLEVWGNWVDLDYYVKYAFPHCGDCPPEFSTKEICDNLDRLYNLRVFDRLHKYEGIHPTQGEFYSVYYRPTAKLFYD